jgi:heme oxygenase (mycobilin-producing)
VSSSGSPQVIKINAITVPGEHGGEMARRFAERIGAVDSQDGFEGFELLRPTDERETWLVVSRWRDEESFQAWVKSPAFAHGHRGVASGQRPLSMTAELWSFDVATAAEPRS